MIILYSITGLLIYLAIANLNNPNNVIHEKCLPIKSLPTSYKEAQTEDHLIGWDGFAMSHHGNIALDLRQLIETNDRGTGFVLLFNCGRFNLDRFNETDKDSHWYMSGILDFAERPLKCNTEIYCTTNKDGTIICTSPGSTCDGLDIFIVINRFIIRRKQVEVTYTTMVSNFISSKLTSLNGF